MSTAFVAEWVRALAEIEVLDVGFSYEPGREVLRQVTLDVPEGSSMSIMGPNGSGKTTLIKTFNGLLLPTKGKVLVDGLATTNTSISQLAKKVGIIFQNPEKSFFSETVRQEIAFGPKNMGFSEKEVDAVVNDVSVKFGLSDYLSSNPFDLSGGEKRRLSIASVLAWRPEVVVMDEPTVGLDHQYRVFLIDVLRGFKAEGKSVVIVTHDVDFALLTSERTALMDDGSMVWRGSLTDLLKSPELFARANMLPTFLTSLCTELLRSGLSQDRFAPVDLASLLGGK
jgi:energy-coupling factor transport system ATP-binding protein